MRKILFLVAVVFLGLGLFYSQALAVTEAECQAINSSFSSVNGICIPNNTGLSEKSVKDIIVAVLGWLLGIFGVLGILVFVVSGIFYFTAAGDAEQEKKAKNAMTMGIIGVIVGLVGFVVIQAIDAALNAKSGF